MRRGRLVIFLALILIVGLVVGGLIIRQVLSRVSARVTPTPTSMQVIIANQRIPQGGKITDDNIGWIDIPQDKVSEVTFTMDRKGDIVGKIARYALEPGVVITRPMVAETAAELAPSGPEWAALIPPGMTAISVPTSRLGAVAYGVADGAHINVNACLLFLDVDPSFQSILPNYTAIVSGTGYLPEKLPVLSLGINSGGAVSAQGRLELEPALQQPFYAVPSEAQRPRLVCQMIFQDVVVMRIGDFPLRMTTLATPVPTGQEQQIPSPDIVTLIVSPQDSVTLTYLIYSGAKLTLTLRNAGDESRMATEAATLQYLLSQYNIPVPAKLPYASQPRIDELAPPIMPNDIVTVTPP